VGNLSFDNDTNLYLTCPYGCLFMLIHIKNIIPQGQASMTCPFILKRYKIPNTIQQMYDDSQVRPLEPEINVCPNCGNPLAEDKDQYNLYECGNTDCNGTWEIKLVKWKTQTEG